MSHVSHASKSNKNLRMRKFPVGPFVGVDNEASDGLSLQKEEGHIPVLV